MSDARHVAAANVLGRQFAVGPLNRAWVADITYCWTREGWLYLAILLDVGSRCVVGWATSPRLDRALVVTALRRAVALRQPGAELVHHSDRGTQYTSLEYGALLAARGIRCSMSRPGDCWDNAVAESFFATLKRELLQRTTWPTRAAATQALTDYIEGWYNRLRRGAEAEQQVPEESHGASYEVAEMSRPTPADNRSHWSVSTAACFSPALVRA